MWNNQINGRKKKYDCHNRQRDTIISQMQEKQIKQHKMSNCIQTYFNSATLEMSKMLSLAKSQTR